MRLRFVSPTLATIVAVFIAALAGASIAAPTVEQPRPRHQVLFLSYADAETILRRAEADWRVVGVAVGHFRQGRGGETGEGLIVVLERP